VPNTLFVPGDSRLHCLHPFTKLTFTLAAMLIVFGGPLRWLGAALPGLLAFLLLWQAGLAGRTARTIFRLLAVLALMLFLVHGFFFPGNRTSLYSIGQFSIGAEGLAYAALVVLRLASALAASLVLLFTTHPAHLVQALYEAGLPYRLAYLLGSPLLLLPQLAGRVKAIQAAQQARGLEIEGNLLRRAAALFPLAAPLIFSALVDVEERALALEVRGFSAPRRKTSLTKLEDTPGQRLARWGMGLLAVFLLVAGALWRAYGSG
jgi:energy-coupling factor transport system permease protein